jgi:hypothetical protein
VPGKATGGTNDCFRYFSVYQIHAPVEIQQAGCSVFGCALNIYLNPDFRQYGSLKDATSCNNEGKAA